MKFCTKRYETTSIQTIEELIAYLRKAESADGETYAVMIAPPDSYSQGYYWLRKVDRYQYQAMEV